MRTLALTGLIFTTCVTANAVASMQQGPGVMLQPHRAVYDLSLAWASDQSGVEGLHGRFVYSFTGGPCEGYVTEMRMVTDITREHGPLVTDQISSSFEDGSKGAFTFSGKVFSDYTLQSETKGEAMRADSRAISLTMGDAGPESIGAAEFPTEYMIHVIAAAKAGKRFYEAASFDGSGENIMHAVTLIGTRQNGEGNVWPITTAYFPVSADGDQAPDFTVSMDLSETGVSRDLLMDFGDFKMAGALSSLDLFASVPCEGLAETAATRH